MAPVAGLAYVQAEDLANDVIICDAGGTTFDVSLVRDGLVEFSRDTWLGPQWVGDNLGMASVAVHSVGAGGGSIAWVDTGGLLRVGPQSAGSEPGPACYQLGGTEPTVTDAAVALGYIDPEHFLGGRMKLSADAAREAIKNVAEHLGQSIKSRGIEKIEKRYFVEARYRFQVWELEIEVPQSRFKDEGDVQKLVEKFHQVHDRVFAVTDEGQAVECLNWRGRLIADVNPRSLEPTRGAASTVVEADRVRGAYFGAEEVQTSIYFGEKLATGAIIEGPAIIEEPTTTIVVYPGGNARVSAGGRYVLTPPEEQRV